MLHLETPRAEEIEEILDLRLEPLGVRAIELFSSEELERIEARINGWIADAHSLEIQEMAIEQARAAGAAQGRNEPAELPRMAQVLAAIRASNTPTGRPLRLDNSCQSSKNTPKLAAATPAQDRLASWSPNTKAPSRAENMGMV